MTATYEVWVKNPKGVMSQVAAPGASLQECELFPSRGGADVPRVMLSRTGAEEVAARIHGLAEEAVHPDFRDKLNLAKKSKGQESIRRKLAKGTVFDQDLAAGIVVSDKATVSKGWCVIKVQMLEPRPVAQKAASPSPAAKKAAPVAKRGTASARQANEG